MNVEIGGGTLPTPGYINLDPVHGTGDFKRYVEEGIPVPDGSVDAVRASHVMEHILAGKDRLYVMNEVHRVLRPGGEFEIIVPTIPQGVGGIGWQAFADPTHVSFWVYPESFHYFDGVFAANADYGIKQWQTKSSELVGGWEAHWVGVKP